ncbi:MAG TPA: hypothetical protein VD962_08390, partial [Rubricoccaceae bacterium]|nr:hypothetical protein [Rubricoccaceae bacterium]
MERPGGGGDLGRREVVDRHHVGLGLEPGDLVVQGAGALVERAVERAERLRRELVGDVGPVHPRLLGLHRRPLGFGGGNERALLVEHPVVRLQVRRHLV